MAIFFLSMPTIINMPIQFYIFCIIYNIFWAQLISEQNFSSFQAMNCYDLLVYAINLLINTN